MHASAPSGAIVATLASAGMTNHILATLSFIGKFFIHSWSHKPSFETGGEAQATPGIGPTPVLKVQISAGLCLVV